MKPKPNTHIDKPLDELGPHPHAVDPDELPHELFPYPSTPHTPTTGLCGKTCYRSETTARKCANLIKKRRASISFLRPYFCQTCKTGESPPTNTTPPAVPSFQNAAPDATAATITQRRMSMNPERQPSGYGVPPQSSIDSSCGNLAQPVQGAALARHTESGNSGHSPLITAHRFASGHVRCAAILGTSSSHSHPAYDDMSFVDPPEILAEANYDYESDYDYDFEEDARERELLMDDLADDNDDFARSEEDGWYYSDED